MFENCSQSRIVEDQRVHLSACVCVPKMQDMNIFSHIDSYPCQGNGVKTRTDEFKIRIRRNKESSSERCKAQVAGFSSSQGIDNQSSSGRITRASTSPVAFPVATKPTDSSPYRFAYTLLQSWNFNQNVTCTIPITLKPINQRHY